MSTRKENTQLNVAGLILAAGMSRRAGDVNKLLFHHNGQPLITHVAQALTDSRLASVLVVVGHDRQAVEKAVTDSAVVVSVNMDYAEGLSTSLVHGISLLFDYDAVVVCLGDMPHVTTDVVNQLINAMVENPHKSYFLPVHEGQRGNPVLITRRRFEDVMSLTGDQGARMLVMKQHEELMEVATECEGVVLDYDTQEELETLVK